MHATLRARAASSLILAAVGLTAIGLGAGCGDDKAKVSADASDAGAEQASKKPALGGKLAAAVKAAESAQAASAKSEDGPPDKGIFAPGAADKVLAAGAAPKVELLGEGSDPKVALTQAPEGEQRVSMSVAFRQQQRGLPIDFSLALKVDKGKDDKGKGDKKDAPAAAGPVKVTGSVASIGVPPQVPKELAEQIAKVKGAEIRYQLAPNGSLSNTGYTLPKGADANMEQILQQLFEGINLLTPPLPDKPVGVGGYWMVTDRVTTGTIEVIRYRVYRVEKVEKDRATLSADVRQYAVKPELDAGGGQKVAMDQFESRGKARAEWTASGLIPGRAEGQVQFGAAARVQNGQQAVLQMDITAKATTAEPEKGEKKK